MYDPGYLILGHATAVFFQFHYFSRRRFFPTIWNIKWVKAFAWLTNAQASVENNYFFEYLYDLQRYLTFHVQDQHNLSALRIINY